MYFARNNEEIHFSFKTSEKKRTQALRTGFFIEHTQWLLLAMVRGAGEK